MTIFELGFNINYTKALLRLLRNRNVLAAMPTEAKVAMAQWLVGVSVCMCGGWVDV